jgi:tripartite-type tricarboxylate transporter receptor subunit TctC
VKAIVPFPAGTAVDIVSRLVLTEIGQQVGQSIIVENRAGAGGTIGAAAVARAEPDGYTLLANSSAHTIAPALFPNLGYDPAKDFVAIAPLGSSPFILVVPPNQGIRSTRDLIAKAQAAPGTLNFASVGMGSASHLSAERFIKSAGINVVHVPFKGGVEAMTEVMAGRIDFFFVAASAALELVKDGKLVALAVNGAARSSALPDVPTLAETGVPNAEAPLWYGLFVPAQTPRDVVDRLHKATFAALQEPKLKEKLAALAIDPMERASQDFNALIAGEVSADAQIVDALGLRPK